MIQHISKEINISFGYAALEDYVLKYTWSAWGYIFAGLPVFLDELWPKEAVALTGDDDDDDIAAAIAKKKNKSNKMAKMHK